MICRNRLTALQRTQGPFARNSSNVELLEFPFVAIDSKLHYRNTPRTHPREIITQRVITHNQLKGLAVVQLQHAQKSEEGEVNLCRCDRVKGVKRTGKSLLSQPPSHWMAASLAVQKRGGGLIRPCFTSEEGMQPREAHQRTMIELTSLYAQCEIM